MDPKLTLDVLTNNLGFIPDMLATFARSPIAFNAWATMRGSLNRVLDLKTRELISLAVSEVNGCNYCLAVHSYAAEKARVLPNDIILARQGHATDPKRDAAVQFTRKDIEIRGQVSDTDVQASRADYTEAIAIEIVTLIAVYSLTNFFNNVINLI